MRSVAVVVPAVGDLVLTPAFRRFAAAMAARCEGATPWRPVADSVLASVLPADVHTVERREVLLSCSGNTRNMLLVLTDAQPMRIYDGAEATFYVISGQGAATVGKLESVITPGSFVAVPRNTPFSLSRQGKQPLALLWVLSGEPCESAR